MTEPTFTAVYAIHRPVIDDAWSCINETCAYDHEDWPCITVQALQEETA